MPGEENGRGDSIQPTDKLSDLTVEDFVGILQALLDRRRAGGDQRLMDMTTKEFLEHMLEYSKTRAYGTAAVEADVAARILTDWKALGDIGAVMSPFRVRDEAGVETLTKDMREFFRTGGKGEYVVAIAIASPSGAYSKPGGTTGLG